MLTIEPLIISFDNAKTASPDASLQSALALTSSSHDAVFIISQEGQILGMISPYHILYHTRPQSNAKVYLYIEPIPRIFKTNTISDLAERMLALRTYTLPVSDESGAISGLVTITSVLKGIITDKKILSRLTEVVKPYKPFTAPLSETLRNIYTPMRKANQSRAILIDSKGKISGIITRRDIADALTKPPSKKQRYARKGGSGKLFFDEDWITKLDYPLNSWERTVLSAQSTDHLSSIITKLIKNQVGSIILVDRDNHPTGIITRRTILRALVADKPSLDIPITIIDKHKILSAFRLQEIMDLMQAAWKKYYKQYPKLIMETTIDAVVKSGGNISSYSVILHFTTSPGNTHIAKTTNHVLRSAVQEAIAKINKQLH